MSSSSLVTIKSPKTGPKKLPFTSSERELLVALVRERPIIEDKRTHAQNIDLKKKAWEELTVAYNSQLYVTPRNNIQLKRCWENIKSQRKKELFLEPSSMKRTGGGPPEGGSVISDNVVDAVCPFINLTVPGVIDSNSIGDNLKEEQKKIDHISVLDLGVLNDNKLVDDTKKIVTNSYDPENSADIVNVDNLISEVDENVPPKPKKRKEISTASTGFKTETEVRVKRSAMNIKHDSELHELRIKREKVLIKREENLIEYEKQLHVLQMEKVRLEIEVLRKKLENKDTFVLFIEILHHHHHEQPINVSLLSAGLLSETGL